ncbi:competence protein ComEC [Novimethylophilus kurashikiensis]|uniref:Competence protein ComEC n=1 Tax=Novimethylophilus kurashikiensis TaxID=1825523 RepID=A0A2R5FCV6_9PROT|nr:ComEC/Rec2 family competence protein [Novimethylophilus kurashikiensis]GBG15689.1 competence protein ComEC [Novimethylophilus kurashikiensis]
MRSRLLAFVAGVWLLQQQAVLPGTYWCLLLLPLLAVIYRLRHRPALFPSLCILAALLAGFFWAAISAQIRLADRLPSAWEGQDIELVGVVSELPKLMERSERFLFDVERVLTPDAHVPQHVSLAYYAAGFDARRSQPLLGRFHPGERWRLTVRLKQPHGTYNPGGFDFEAWALERNIRATGYLKNSTRLDAMVWRPGYVIERLRQAVRDRFQFVLGGKPYEGVLRALAIGDQGGISSDDWQVFLRTGVNHLMSIRYLSKRTFFK